jgi:uncharacterized protein YyaL (SSP411 family)
MPNRLARETSPYLLQHAENPVNWYAWSEEAFEQARERDLPVFLSIGYSSCHWCHVMAHESFESGEVAEVLNRDFISVKVDREERPDVDEAYMAATQLYSGRGGWPMSVFLTPDKKPFFAATYFPRETFLHVLSQVTEAWTTRRRELQAAGDEFARSLAAVMGRDMPAAADSFLDEAPHHAVQFHASEFDQTHGGFGDKPKFPPHTAIEFLVTYALWEEARQELRDAALAMTLLTLERMCMGGIHDLVGGGFHRYSTDERWLLPHFEKMLYDNALMLGNLAWGIRIATELHPELAGLLMQAAERLTEWLVREMRSPDGLFFSAQDADVEGEEGKHYVWTSAEIGQVLGTDATAAMELFGVRAEGNFHDEASGELTGANVLHLSTLSTESVEGYLDRLLEVRLRRPAPGTDHKALVSWNGLLIAALCEVGALELAQQAAEAVLSAESALGHLPHQIVNGQASGLGFLDDYAALCFGLLALAEEDGGGRWRGEAVRIADQMVRLFFDHERGGFFGTSEMHEHLFGRTKPVFDQPVPSGNSLAIRCLIRLERREEAERSLRAVSGMMEHAPGGCEGLYTALLELRRGPNAGQQRDNP